MGQAVTRLNGNGTNKVLGQRSRAHVLLAPVCVQCFDNKHEIISIEAKICRSHTDDVMVDLLCFVFGVSMQSLVTFISPWPAY